MYMFPTRLHVHQRMNANGTSTKWLFSWNNNTMKYNAYDEYLHYCWSMHEDTYSVHDRPLKPWWGRLPCFQTSCYVFSPPLSRLNWRSLSPIGGPGPPAPKVASLSLGSAHTPFPGSRTVHSLLYGGPTNSCCSISFLSLIVLRSWIKIPTCPCYTVIVFLPWWGSDPFSPWRYSVLVDISTRFCYNCTPPWKDSVKSVHSQWMSMLVLLRQQWRNRIIARKKSE